MNFYFAEGSTQKGPYPVDQLIAQGLRRDSLVWREGMVQWQRADTVAELAGLFNNAPQAGSYQQGSYGQPPSPAAQPPYPAQHQQPYAPQPPFGPTPPQSFDASSANSQKIAAGICGILIGGFGIHKFILGMTGPGLIMLLVTLLTCGFGGIVMHIIGIIEGIIYLTKTDQDFYQMYMVEKKGWF